MYVCQQLDMAGNTCLVWVEQSTPLLDSLAITEAEAGALALAMVSVMLLSWVGGFIGRIMLKHYF